MCLRSRLLIEDMETPLDVSARQGKDSRHRPPARRGAGHPEGGVRVATSQRHLMAVLPRGRAPREVERPRPLSRGPRPLEPWVTPPPRVREEPRNGVLGQ
jgi:hypothetical protein